MRINQLDGTRTGLTALCIAVSLVLIATEAMPAPRVVLIVEDARGTPIISGESTDPNYPGWIDAIAIGTGFDKLPTGGAARLPGAPVSSSPTRLSSPRSLTDHRRDSKRRCSRTRNSLSSGSSISRATRDRPANRS